MKARLHRIMDRRIAYPEAAIYGLLAVSFFIGVWHGFPLTNIVADEMFPGGVLRSMTHGSLLPQGMDIPYGTITFYLTYAAVSVVLGSLLPFTGFSVAALKSFIIGHIFIAYLAGRLVSVAAAICLLWLAVKMCLESGTGRYWKLVIVPALFTTMIVASMFHTGKVWPVSVLLVFVSFYFLVKSSHRQCDEAERPSFMGDSDVWAVVFSFLAFANFPLMGFSLICLPALLYIRRKEPSSLKRIACAILIGMALLGFFFALNGSGIQGQVGSIVNDYTLSPAAQAANASFIRSFFLNAEKTATVYPIMLLFLVIGLSIRSKIKDRELFSLSLIYLIVYYIAISVVARWSTDLYSFLRYLLPIGFFLFGMLAAIEVRVRWYHVLGVVASALFLALELYYISMPTTYNIANEWVRSYLDHTGAVIERFGISDMDLPMNASSSGAVSDALCSTRCQAVRGGLIAEPFKAIVVTEQTDGASAFGYISDAKERYIVTDAPFASSSNSSLVAAFKNGSPYGIQGYPPIIEHLGSYFDPVFFTLDRLGRDIYIYSLK